MVLATQPDMSLVTQASNGREAVQRERPIGRLWNVVFPRRNGH